MTNILEKIISDKKNSLEVIKKGKSLDTLEKNIEGQSFLNFPYLQCQYLKFLDQL